MVYIYLTDTNTTDLVSLAPAMNNNWDQIDDKFSKINAGGSAVGTGVVNPETGMEFVNDSQDLRVWTGSSYKAIDGAETWGSWINITLTAPFVAVAGSTPQLRISSGKVVQLRGSVQDGAGAVAWPAGFQVINQNQFADATYSPGVVCVRQIIGAVPAGVAWSYGQIFVSSAGGFLKIWAQYVGTAGGGNYLALDNCRFFAGN